MKFNLYSMLDKVSGTYSPVSMFRNESEAIRSTTRALDNGYRNVPSFIHTDFRLYKLGVFDDETGVIVSLPNPEDIWFDYKPPEVPNVPRKADQVL